MERIAIRELRNYASRVVRRARSGERIVITVDGIPAAQIGPLNDGGLPRTLDDLIAGGLVLPPRTAIPPESPQPIRSNANESSTRLLRRHRDR